MAIQEQRDALEKKAREELADIKRFYEAKPTVIRTEAAREELFLEANRKKHTFNSTLQDLMKLGSPAAAKLLQEYERFAQANREDPVQIRYPERQVLVREAQPERWGDSTTETRNISRTTDMQDVDDTPKQETVTTSGYVPAIPAVYETRDAFEDDVPLFDKIVWLQGAKVKSAYEHAMQEKFKAGQKFEAQGDLKFADPQTLIKLNAASNAEDFNPYDVAILHQQAMDEHDKKYQLQGEIAQAQGLKEKFTDKQTPPERIQNASDKNLDELYTALQGNDTADILKKHAAALESSKQIENKKSSTIRQVQATIDTSIENLFSGVEAKKIESQRNLESYRSQSQDINIKDQNGNPSTKVTETLRKEIKDYADTKIQDTVRSKGNDLQRDAYVDEKTGVKLSLEQLINSKADKGNQVKENYLRAAQAYLQDPLDESKKQVMLQARMKIQPASSSWETIKKNVGFGEQERVHKFALKMDAYVAGVTAVKGLTNSPLQPSNNNNSRKVNNP